MAEYDDERYDYDENYDDENYDDYQNNWGNNDDNEMENLIQDYNQKIDDLNKDLSRKRKEETKKIVENEIYVFKRRLNFLEKLRDWQEKWKPRSADVINAEAEIKVLEKNLKDARSSLNRCRREDSIAEKKKLIALLEKTLEFYKKSIPPEKKTKPKRKFVREKRLPTKSSGMREDDTFKRGLSNLGGMGINLAKGSWWATKSAFGGIGYAVKGVASAATVTGNKAIELSSTFRENLESLQRVEERHEEIDRETEQKNEEIVKQVDDISIDDLLKSAESLHKEVHPEFLDAKSGEEIEAIKTQVINLGIEKNNLEGEKRKEEVTRQENEKLCQEEEKKQENEEKLREHEENLRKQEEIRKKEYNNWVKKIKNLGEGLSENEEIRIQEEDIRQEEENIRQMNENERQSKEDTRQTFEKLRQEDEKIRQTLDNNRKIYWETMLEKKEEWLQKMGHNNEVFQKLMDVLVVDDKRRNNLEITLNANEDKRLGNEQIRLDNEKDRRDAEEIRVKNENQRIENEKQRIAAEFQRVTGETKREENEKNRIEEEEKRFVNEEERLNNERLRISQEKIRLSAEKQRLDNEKQRMNFFKNKLESIPDQEKERVSAEKGRKEREQIFQQNEKLRVEAEKKRLENEERRAFIQEQNLKLLEDRKNKIDEIEMKFSKKHRIEEKQPKKTFETYFTNKENSTTWIEDEKMRKKVEEILDNIDKEDENKPQTYSNALLDGIDQMKDVNLTAEWEKRMIIEEKEKLKWRQKINALNEALLEKNIVLTDNDQNIKDFYDKHIKHSETTKNELNGFFYDGIKVIKRTSQKTFILSQTKSVQEKLNEFLGELRKINGNAETIISNEVGIFSDSGINKELAEDYIRQLREEQKEMIRRGEHENGEFFEMEDFNEINREIENIRQNKKFKIRPKVWAKSFGGYVSRFVKYLKIIFRRVRLRILTGLVVAAIGSAGTFMVMKKFLESAGDKLAEFDKHLPEKLKKLLSKQFEPLEKMLHKFLGNYYTYYLGVIFAWIAYFFRWSIFRFTKSIVYVSADIFGLMGKLSYTMMTGFGILAYYPTTKILDYAGYYAYKWWEKSFYMNDELPPVKILERRAEDENMTLDEYKRKFVSMEKYYNSKLAKILSYPVSIASGASATMTDEGKEVLDWMANWGIVAGVLFGIIFFIWILIKWR